LGPSKQMVSSRFSFEGSLRLLITHLTCALLLQPGFVHRRPPPCLIHLPVESRALFLQPNDVCDDGKAIVTRYDGASYTINHNGLCLMTGSTWVGATQATAMCLALVRGSSKNDQFVAVRVGADLFPRARLWLLTIGPAGRRSRERRNHRLLIFGCL
jgi:hypothetical protein